MMNVRTWFDPSDLVELTPDLDDVTPGDPGEPVIVAFAGGAACIAVTEEQALAIAEAWRHLEQQILERRHGVLAVL